MFCIATDRYLTIHQVEQFCIVSITLQCFLQFAALSTLDGLVVAISKAGKSVSQHRKERFPPHNMLTKFPPRMLIGIVIAVENL